MNDNHPISFPAALNPSKVGSYPKDVPVGGGIFYDEVLEYRVWNFHYEKPTALDGIEISAENLDDEVTCFSTYEEALDFSQKTAGVDEPVVLVLQREYTYQTGTHGPVGGQRTQGKETNPKFDTELFTRDSPRSPLNLRFGANNSSKS
jgi:hypothetical protein